MDGIDGITSDFKLKGQGMATKTREQKGTKGTKTAAADDLEDTKAGVDELLGKNGHEEDETGEIAASLNPAPRNDKGGEGELTLPGMDLSGRSSELLWLDPAEVSRSPYQVRRDFDGAKLRELAEGIRVNGQQEPGVVRRNARGEWELLFGERRLRACAIAGVSFMAIERRGVNDFEAALSGFVENYHREDLTPLEEAEGFALLLSGVGGEKLNQSQLAARLGVTAVHVTRRMKLTNLSEVWRGAFKDAKSPVHAWPAAHMEYLAKFPQVMQDRLFVEFGLDDVSDYERKEKAGTSLEDLKREIAEMLHTVGEAPWSAADETLHAKAGSCTACPKRSGCQNELFDPGDFDIEERHSRKTKPRTGEVCLDAECWSEKLKRFVDRKKTELVKEHGKGTVKLITGRHETARLSKGKIEHRYSLSLKSCKADAPGAELVIDVDTGKFGWKRDAYKYPRGGSASGGGSAKKASGEKPKAKPLKERKAAYDRRRLLALAGKLDEAFDTAYAALEKKPGETLPENLKHLDTEYGLALAATLGMNAEVIQLLHEDRIAFERMRKGPEQRYKRVITAGALGELHDEVKCLFTARDLESMRDTLDWACEAVGIDFANEYATVCEEIPYPKSWAAEAEALDAKSSAKAKGKTTQKGTKGTKKTAAPAKTGKSAKQRAA